MMKEPATVFAPVTSVMVIIKMVVMMMMMMMMMHLLIRFSDGEWCKLWIIEELANIQKININMVLEGASVDNRRMKKSVAVDAPALPAVMLVALASVIHSTKGTGLKGLMPVRPTWTRLEVHGA